MAERLTVQAVSLTVSRFLPAALYVAATVLAGSICGWAAAPAPSSSVSCLKTTRAKVVAIEQNYIYNRFGAFNPAGLMYALQRDVVVDKSDDEPGVANVPGNDGDAISKHLTGNKLKDARLAGHVGLRENKRPRPLVLRVNEGDCLEVTFTNLLSPFKDGNGLDTEAIIDPETGQPAAIESDEPATRYASIHVNGLDYAGTIESDGANAGRNRSSLAAPGQTRVYKWYAKKEGAYLFFSMAAPAGGEGDGGQLGLGLFGSVNVEPRNARWFRSQVTETQLKAVTVGANPNGTPQLRYEANGATGFGMERGPDGKLEPILEMVNRAGEIVHSDINAIIAFEKDINGGKGEECDTIKGYSSSCGTAFREFTTIFHDELTVSQAFRDLEDENKPISIIRDGMGINYGAAGLGAMVLANRQPKGPAANCVECKLEEFFLSSWAMGDPAMIADKDETGKAVRARYSDDPSNVHHSYLGDPVRFRNMHAGPKETHVFHLHAHQWVYDWQDPNSVYLDSQTISPGSSFTYEIQYSGSGNRNLTPGDSIFHCHLYPHFAQGMWELWRTHDVFENGSVGRNLPDAEIAGGTPNPAVVPLPRAPLPPMPSPAFKGYPFYIPGVAGHRPPQPPMDIDPESYAGGLGGDTLGRHVVLSGERLVQKPAVEEHYLHPEKPGFDPRAVSSVIAARVVAQNPDPELLLLASQLKKAKIQRLPEDGTLDEKKAMDFHAGKFAGGTFVTSHYGVPNAGYPTCDSYGRCADVVSKKPLLFRVNGLNPQPGAPFADPCPPRYFLGPDSKVGDNSYWHDLPPLREYKAAYIQFDMTVNKAGWHDPQARIIVLENDVKDTLDYKRPAEPLFFRANSGECVIFKATNLVPSNLNVDDFQVFSPTDEIGQHIHLVKFDVTSSDGSANGWNYEDATLSPEEIQERIAANNAYQKSIGGSAMLTPKTHRIFLPGGAMAMDARGQCPVPPADVTDEAYVEELKKHPWCGAQTTIQRWWADPLLERRDFTTPNGFKDRTIRTVFTHDHLGPSSHQHHGLYAALVIEPTGSTWETLDGTPMGGVDQAGSQIVKRPDGGPTSYAANIVDHKQPLEPKSNKREYGLAFADFSILYTKEIESTADPLAPGNYPVNPPSRMDHELPQAIVHSAIPRPEGISASDPGSQLLNYRNDPLALRIGKPQSAPFPGRYEQRRADDANPQCKAAVLADGELCMNAPAGAAQDACIKHYCDAGDPGNVLSSRTHAWQDEASFKSSKFLTSPEPDGLRKPGDPATPLLGAYEGDQVQLRLIQGAQEENHVFSMQGTKWLAQPDMADSGWLNGQHIGISEHFEFNVDTFSEENGQPADHIYRSTATDNLWDGQWGLMRVLPNDPPFPGLKQFEYNKEPKHNPGADVCPLTAPDLWVQVVAMPASELPGGSLVYNSMAGIKDSNAILFVRTAEEYTNGGPVSAAFAANAQETLAKLRNGSKKPEPLIIRAAAGDCIHVNLINGLGVATRDQMKDGPQHPSSWSYNMLPPTAEHFNFNQVQSSHRVGLMPQLVAVNPIEGDGANVGGNPDLLVPRWIASSKKFKNEAFYTWFAGDEKTGAPVEFGVAAIMDMGDVVKHSSHGAVGALVIEPRGTEWKTDCEIVSNPGADCLEAAATVTFKNGNQKPFREFVAIVQNDVSAFYQNSPLPNLRNADDAEDSGQKAINYRSEPLWARLQADPEADPGEMANFDYRNAYTSIAVCDDGSKELRPDGKCQDGSIPARGHGDPETPLFTAMAGDQVRFRVVEPMGHPRNHAFTVFGHDWPVSPAASDKCGAQQIASCRLDDRVIRPAGVTGPSNLSRYYGNRVGTINGIGPQRHIDAVIESAGGVFKIAGDYMYRTHEGFTSSGGIWGLMRVIDPKDCQAQGMHFINRKSTSPRDLVCR